VRPTRPAKDLKTLQAVVNAHIVLNKGKHERSDGGAAGHPDWRPPAFIVVVQGVWKTKSGGLLFVYADDEKDCGLNSFFLKVEDAYMMLSSLGFVNEELARSKELYGQEPRH
jgi:hypothetical protein